MSESVAVDEDVVDEVDEGPVRCPAQRQKYWCERVEEHDGPHAQIEGDFLVYWTEDSRGVTFRFT